MKLRDFGLLTDENIDADVVAHLRARGFNVRDVVEEGIQGSTDGDLLRIAVADKRLIVTHDTDFGTLGVHDKHPVVGVILLRPGHIDPQFTIGTIDAMLADDPDIIPPVIVVAKRLAKLVTIRVRTLGVENA